MLASTLKYKNKFNYRVLQGDSQEFVESVSKQIIGDILTEGQS